MNKYFKIMRIIYIFSIIVTALFILLYFLKGDKFLDYFKRKNKKNINYDNILEKKKLKNEILYNRGMDNYNSMQEYYQKGIYKAPYKIIVLGDVHGDWDATISALKKARVIDDNLNWVGGKTQVVQMGDILDRKIRGNCNKDEDSEFKIISLFVKLMEQSYKVGGGFHCIFGNHELMNVIGDFSYVSEMGIKHFQKGIDERKEYFKLGGKMCKLFAQYWNPIIIIGKYLFCHGSVSYDIGVNYNIKEINKLMRKFLMTNNVNSLSNSEVDLIDELFFKDKSILWNREFMNGNFDKSKLKEMLSLHKCEYMVVGHTVQPQGINLKGECIWFTDTGMSEAFGKRKDGKRIQVLQILRNGKSLNVLI